MNKRFVGVLMFAFVVATAGGLITYRSLISRSQPARAAGPTTQIVLASRDLDSGTVLKEGDLQLVDWPGAVPAGATNKVQDLVGRGVITRIYAKEPVIDSRLAPMGAGGGLAAMIPNGMRAFAISVNEVVGVAGFVTAGQHVDVLISGNRPGGDGDLGMLSKTLLQNLEVLSAGQDYKKDPEGKPLPVQVVNLLVTPQQAEVLSLASSQTSIRLVLRNPMDHEVAKTPGTALAYLFQGAGLKPLVAPQGEPGPPRPRAAPAPRPVVLQEPPKKAAPFVMEIISGTSKTEAKFDNSKGGK